MKNPINEGERRSACFAKACNIYYYMSDDNTAAPHIRSLVAIETVNFCDILFLHLKAFGKSKISQLKDSYGKFIALYEQNKIPRILKDKEGIFTFEKAMGSIYSKFQKSEDLTRLVENIVENTTGKKYISDTITTIIIKKSE